MDIHGKIATIIRPTISARALLQIFVLIEGPSGAVLILIKQPGIRALL